MFFIQQPASAFPIVVIINEGSQGMGKVKVNSHEEMCDIEGMLQMVGEKGELEVNINWKLSSVNSMIWYDIVMKDIDGIRWWDVRCGIFHHTIPPCLPISKTCFKINSDKSGTLGRSWAVCRCKVRPPRAEDRRRIQILHSARHLEKLEIECRVERLGTNPLYWAVNCQLSNMTQSGYSENAHQHLKICEIVCVWIG